MARLTTNGLRANWTGRDRWLSDGGTRGDGCMLARITSNGVHFYFQYFNSRGKKRLLPLGKFDVDGRCGISLMAVRAKAADISKLYRSGTKDLHEYFEQKDLAERLAHQKEIELAERERQAREDAVNRFSLKKLLMTYVAHLRASNKSSASDGANIFKNHVLSDSIHPERLAAEVSTDEWVGLIGKVVAAGHGRTGAKLRSYAHAAYQLAMHAKTDPAAPEGLKEFDIKVNPLTPVSALSQFNKSLDRNLDGPEFAAFLRRIQAVGTTCLKRKMRFSLCI